MIRKAFRIALAVWMINFVLFICAALFEILVLPSGAVVPEWLDSWWDTTMCVALAYPPFALITYRKDVWKSIKDFVNGD